MSSDQSLFQKRVTCKKQGEEEKKKQKHRLRTNRNRLQNLFHGYMLTMKTKDVVKSLIRYSERSHVISTMKSMKDVFRPIRQFGMNLTQKRLNHFHRL